MDGWRLIIDVERCEDCNNCVLACKDEHVGNEWPGYAAAQPLHGQRWIDVERTERGDYPLIDVAYLPLTCMQCDEAPCVAAGAGALRKREDGIVLIDPVLARGRRDVVASCPYGAIWWNEEAELPQKCTFCAHLLDGGWAQPRCVQACPTGALAVLRAGDANMAALAERDHLEVLRPDYGTAPRVYYRNLHRWNTFRVSGTVTIDRDGVVDCAAGAAVTLRARVATTGTVAEGADAAPGALAAPAATPGVAAAATVTDPAAPGTGAATVVRPVTMAKTVTDPFGDFAFDGLPAKPTTYLLRAEMDGYETTQVDIRLVESLTVEPIHLTRRST
jgi:Fe-S-cluster-containing dehydrogenase component